MAKRKTRAEPSPLEVAAFDAYAKTGDTTALLALADYLDEAGGRKAFARRLRGVGKRRDGATHFFFGHCGWSYAERQTEREGQLAAAVALARAEARWEVLVNADFSEHRTRWELDEDYDYNPNDYDSPGMPPVAFGCVLEVMDTEASMRRRDNAIVWDVLASLWGVTLGPPHDDPFADPYHRVVQAELALEVFGRR